MRYLVAIAAATALMGCSEPKQNVPEVEKAGHEATGNAADVVVNETAAAPIAGDAIPEPLRGRWGMTANDCDPKQDFAAKGLIAIDAKSLKFYEARATLGTVHASDQNSINADFAFTGEGQDWSLRVSLVREGNKLLRSEQGEGAVPQPLEYTRCPA